MTIQVSTTDARTAKALELLSGADRWLKITSKANRRRYYVVTGSNGQLYWANLVECTCPDHTRRGTRCKHILAVALHVSRVNIERRLASGPAVMGDTEVWFFRIHPMGRNDTMHWSISAPLLLATVLVVGFTAGRAGTWVKATGNAEPVAMAGDLDDLGDCGEGTAKKLFIDVELDANRLDVPPIVFFQATTDTLAAVRAIRGSLPVEPAMTAASINRDAVAEAKRILTEQCGAILDPKLKVILVGGARMLK